MRAPRVALARPLALVLALAALLVGPAALLAAPASAAGVELERVGRFAEPVYVTSPPGAARDLVVVQRYGLIRVVRRGRILRRPLADLRRRVLVGIANEGEDQRGLFSVAFPANYRRAGRFYVQYVDRHGRLRVDELRRGRSGSRLVLDLGPAANMHHGGQLQFGPDGLLYVSTGMNDDPSSSQDPAATGGKILRLDPRAPVASAEVYALGLRNPWRFSFDRRTGALLIGDVGGDAAEEVNLIAPGAPPGSNFGWPAYEGTARTPATPDVAGALAPALSYGHDAGRCAITGGYVVRDRRLPTLAGRYVYGDLCTGAVYAARFAGATLGRPRRVRVPALYLVSFGEDASGRLYAVSFNGDVFRFSRG
jgi:glucose/arabinose dehydrogenase